VTCSAPAKVFAMTETKKSMKKMKAAKYLPVGKYGYVRSGYVSTSTDSTGCPCTKYLPVRYVHKPLVTVTVVWLAEFSILRFENGGLGSICVSKYKRVDAIFILPYTFADTGTIAKNKKKTVIFLYALFTIYTFMFIILSIYIIFIKSIYDFYIFFYICTHIQYIYYYVYYKVKDKDKKSTIYIWIQIYSKISPGRTIINCLGGSAGLESGHENILFCCKDIKDNQTSSCIRLYDTYGICTQNM